MSQSKEKKKRRKTSQMHTVEVEVRGFLKKKKKRRRRRRKLKKEEEMGCVHKALCMLTQVCIYGRRQRQRLGNITSILGPPAQWATEESRFCNIGGCRQMMHATWRVIAIASEPFVFVYIFQSRQVLTENVHPARVQGTLDKLLYTSLPFVRSKLFLSQQSFWRILVQRSFRYVCQSFLHSVVDILAPSFYFVFHAKSLQLMSVRKHGHLRSH